LVIATNTDAKFMLHGRLLRYLDEVARCGSIRKASLRLNVAASAINRQLIELEEDVGSPIFERLPGGLRLTATGEILIGHVRETLREHKRALSRITALRGLMRGEVCIATNSGLAAGILADALAAFRMAHPRVKLTIRILGREEIAETVLSGEADLGLAYNIAINPRLMRAAAFEFRLGAVVAAGHPLATRRSVRLADCLDYPMVAAEPGLSLREVLDLMVPPGVEFAPIVETNSLELMRRLARDVPNVAFLNMADVDQDLRSGSLIFVPFDAPAAHQNVFLIHRQKGSPDPAASMVMQYIVEKFRSSPKRG